MGMGDIAKSIEELSDRILQLESKLDMLIKKIDPPTPEVPNITFEVAFEDVRKANAELGYLWNEETRGFVYVRDSLEK